MASRPAPYRALATDYDGTIARDGAVDSATAGALGRLRGAGWFLVLVTGRELEALLRVFPPVDLFDRVVAENGVLLYRPSDRTETVLADPPPPGFVDALKARGVGPLSAGRVIVATWRPHETAVAEQIREWGMDYQVILNKRAVMVLPAGVNKGSGLKAALEELGIPPTATVAVGDAENDLPMFDIWADNVAVANAVEPLKRRADLVLDHDHGTGVVDLIRWLLDDVPGE